jgi:serine/threonine-protein kinase
MGTVAYLSPEQVERGVADPRSDIYAAGILLYEMLTGLKPYDGETAIQIAYRHVHDSVPAPSELVPSLPGELDALVARATNRDPDGRPADARRFLTEVTSARRQLSDGELDALGPALAPVTGPPDQTLVVDLRETAERGPARRGDTGPLATPDRGPRRRRSRGPLALLIVLALAVGLSGFAWLYAAVLSKTTTPGLLDLTRVQAAAKAEKAGLDVKVVERDFSETVPAGKVLETDPAPGHSIDKGGTVGLILSKGPERYGVPKLRGRTEEVARRLIEERNLTVGTPERRYSQKVEKGSVISSDPPAGTEVKPDTAVVLVISDGVEPVAVPNVVGQPIDAAKAAIADAKLRSEVTEEFNETVPAGVVISQDPAGGAGATAGKRSLVQLVVSKGPPMVEVPDVVGKPVAEAQQILTAAGLVPSVNQLPTGPGIVRGQSPGAGDKHPKGTTVTLYVY